LITKEETIAMKDERKGSALSEAESGIYNALFGFSNKQFFFTFPTRNFRTQDNLKYFGMQSNIFWYII